MNANERRRGRGLNVSLPDKPDPFFGLFVPLLVACYGLFGVITGLIYLPNTSGLGNRDMDRLKEQLHDSGIGYFPQTKDETIIYTFEGLSGRLLGGGIMCIALCMYLMLDVYLRNKSPEAQTKAIGFFLASAITGMSLITASLMQ